MAVALWCSKQYSGVVVFVMFVVCSPGVTPMIGGINGMGYAQHVFGI